MECGSEAYTILSSPAPRCLDFTIFCYLVIISNRSIYISVVLVTKL